MTTKKSKNKIEGLKTFVFSLFVLIFLVIFTGLNYKTIPTPPWKIQSDATHYLIAAYNIKKHQIFSGNFQTDMDGKFILPTPTAKREPGYPTLLSLGMILIADFEDLPEDAFLITKGENRGSILIPSTGLSILEMIVLFVTSSLSMFTAYLITRNRFVSLVALFGVGFSPALVVGIRTFLKENATAFLIIAFSLLLFLLVKNRKRGLAIHAGMGLLLGIATLTNAIFQYAWLPVSIFLLLYYIKEKIPWKKWMLFVIVFLLSYFALVTPWMARNYIHFNRPFISERGGSILLIRAYYNMMTPKEYVASFFWWTPTRYTKDVVYKLFGHNEVKRLDMEDSDNYKRRSKEVRGEIYNKYNNRAEADAILKSMAIDKIKQHPIRHMLTCIPFAWRGIFVEIDDHFFLPAALISLMLFSGFFLFILWALKKAIQNKWEYSAFIFLSVYFYSIHVIATHNLPRYNTPLIPILWICSVIDLQILIKWALEKIKNTQTKKNLSIAVRTLDESRR